MKDLCGPEFELEWNGRLKIVIDDENKIKVIEIENLKSFSTTKLHKNGQFENTRIFWHSEIFFFLRNFDK